MDRQTAEQRRRQYLARMGLQLPWLLPVASTATRPVSTPAVRPAMGRRLRDNPAPVERPAAPAAAVAPTAAPVPASAVPVAAFSLLALRTADGLLLLDTAPGRLAAWPADRQTLALDLLTALAGSPVTVDWQQCLAWPLTGSHSTAGEAREVVLGLLAGQVERAALRHVLLLGDALPQWLEAALNDQPLQQQVPAGLGRPCLFLPGWPAGLDAAAKRALWQALAALPVGA